MLNTRVRKTVQVICVMGALLAGVSHAQAQEPTYTKRGTITTIEAGWREETMAVWHSAAMINTPCTVKNYGYATDPADSGRTLFHTVILNAFLNKREVQLVVSGCVFGKPKIIGVKVY
jgi:hypothetical protein